MAQSTPWITVLYEGGDPERVGNEGRKFTELPAQLILLFSEHDPSHQSWCSTNSRCYNGPFIIALYEVMYLSRSVPLTAPLPQPGSRSQVPVVSWVIAANLHSPVIGLYIYTLFYARDTSSHCGLRRLSAWLVLVNGMSTDITSTEGLPYSLAFLIVYFVYARHYSPLFYWIATTL